jgi:hypothetical protein
VLFVTGACLERNSLPLDNLLSLLWSRVGVARVAAAIDPRGVGVSSFLGILELVAALPYARRLRLTAELADRFRVDQAAERAASGLFLERGDLGRLATFGCELGNHTRSHVFCRALVNDESAEYELVEHARELAALAGAPIRAFSYPYGYRRDATPLTERVLRASGHHAVFLAESRPHVGGSHGRLLNRIGMDGCSTRRIGHELELLPRLRGARDRLRTAARAA